MQSKPADFFLGVFDLFAIVLPGALLTFLLVAPVKAYLPELFALIDQSDEARLGAFLFAAYLLGHLLHQLGFVLDKIYDASYVRRHKRRKGDDPLYAGAKAVANEWERSDLFSRVGSFVRLNSAAATSEIDRQAADSKFFRSITFVALIGCVLSATGGHWPEFVASLTLTLFSFWRFCYLRWKSTELTYEYFILLRNQTVLTTRS